jgi:hypothetical protein
MPWSPRHIRFVVNRRAGVARGRVVEAPNVEKLSLDGRGYQLPALNTAKFTFIITYSES